MTAAFPYNLVDAFAAEAVTYFSVEGYNVVRRPIRLMDSGPFISVFPWDVAADPSSYQIGQIEPATRNYTLRLQTKVEAADEEEGMVLATNAATRLTVMLYKAPQLPVRLTSCSVDLLGLRENYKRHTVLNTKFINGALNNGFVYMTSTDIKVETELRSM